MDRPPKSGLSNESTWAKSFPGAMRRLGDRIFEITGMQYDADSPAAYLEMLEDDWRKSKLFALRELVLSLAPNLVEEIEYKMLVFKDNGQFKLALNAQKGYVSLYVGDIDKVDPSRTLLNGVKTGKGCIRFTKSHVLENTGIREFLVRAIALEDTRC